MNEHPHEDAQSSDTPLKLVIVTTFAKRSTTSMIILLPRPQHPIPDPLFEEGEAIVIEGNGKSFVGKNLRPSRSGRHLIDLLISVESVKNIEQGMTVRKR
jgi:hypothetical protein